MTDYDKGHKSVINYYIILLLFRFCTLFLKEKKHNEISKAFVNTGLCNVLHWCSDKQNNSSL